MTIENNTKKYMIGAMKAVFVLLQVGCILLCWKYYQDMLYIVYYWKGFTTIGIAYGLLLIVLLEYFAGFNVGMYRIRDIAYGQCCAIVSIDIIVYALLFFVYHGFVNPLPLIVAFLIQICIAVIWSLAANTVFFLKKEAVNTAVVCNKQSDIDRIKYIHSFNKKYKIKFEILNPNSAEEVTNKIKEEFLNDRLDIVFVAGVDSQIRDEILKLCLAIGLECQIVPTIEDLLLNEYDIYCVGGGLFVNVQKVSSRTIFGLIKRIFDICSSAMALIILSPLLLVVALLIHSEDKGPAIYKQIRLTKDRREFTIYKFRSMRMDAEVDGIARLATDNDDRITKIVNVIRACRIDELPQLVNVLKGDMSIVGPRPERPEIAEEYEKQLPEFGLRLQVKAGLTGYAQVYGRYNTEPYEKLQMDLLYLKRMSVFEDLKIIITTIKILFTHDSTQGIKEGATNAQRDDVENPVSSK